MSTLIINALVYSPSVPFASALLIVDGHIAWIGDRAGADVHRDIADSIVDACGALITPGFVDSHVHSTSAGLLISGIDLSAVTSARELLKVLTQLSHESRGAPIWGHGWDETLWDDPTLPTREEIDKATWGSEVYLSRIDVHSALVSSALIARVPDARTQPGFGPLAVTQQAHHAVRSHALTSLHPQARERAQRAFLRQCAERGIVSVHEMAGPGISSTEDARSLMGIVSENTPNVFLYWGELAQDGGISTARELGAVGVGGDLFIDGALGSRTALLSQPYCDASQTTGAAYLDVDGASEHIRLTTGSGLAAGFHVIGDEGCSVAMNAFARVAQEHGPADLRRSRHRLEHAEMMSTEHLDQAANWGVILGMQPLFDALWGGSGGMYEQRLGERASSMNRWGSALARGTKVTFSSDAPVTESDPWRIIQAAMEHHNSNERVSARAAFSAMTRASWHAVGIDAGEISVGAPAHLALWDVQQLEVQAPDTRVERWSTDPRSATPPLPALGDSIPPPQCLMTIRSGTVIYRREDSPISFSKGAPSE